MSNYRDTIEKRLRIMSSTGHYDMSYTNRLEGINKKRMLYIEGRDEGNIYKNVKYLRTLKKTDGDIF